MEVTATTPSFLAGNQDATFQCTFTNSWTVENHPEQFPSANAHWSPFVLAAHNDGYEMWAPGSTASPGVENVAETGSTIALTTEIGANGDASSFVMGRGFFIPGSSTETLDPITVTSEFNLLSLISMIAPSPDWFSGIYNYNPLDMATGVWYESFDIDVFPWDAGTEMGNTYAINNAATDPATPIFQITKETAPSNTTGVFLNGTASSASTTVLPVGTVSCELVDAPLCTRRPMQCDASGQCCSGVCVSGFCRSNRVPGGNKANLRLSALTGRGGAAGQFKARVLRPQEQTSNENENHNNLRSSRTPRGA